MIEKGFTGAPFGLQSHRFDLGNVHPKNKMPGTFIGYGPIDNNLGPGYYNYEDRSSSFCHSKLLKDSNQSDWKKKYQTEKFSEMPYILNKELYLNKLEEKRNLGPGHYSFDLSTLKDNPSIRGVMSDLEPRFSTNNKENLTGPGNYGKNGIPHLLKEEGDAMRKSASKIGFLNNGGDGERKLPSYGSDLPPNIYNIKSFTDEVIDHRAGKRGYYDVFSLNRGKPIKTGHLAINPAHNLAPNHYKIKSVAMDVIDKSFVGHFNRCKQYPDKPYDKQYWDSPANMPPDPKNQLSAATYFPNDSEFTNQGENSKPFNSSSQRNDRRSNMFFTGNFNPVGVGRYDVRLFKINPHKKVYKKDLKSMTDARPTILENRIISERLKERNIPPSMKHYIDHIPTEESPSVDKSLMSFNHHPFLKLS